MAIMKFKKGKNDRTVIGGLGDNSAHFDGTTYAETKELDLYKAKYDLLISLWVWLDDNVESDSPQAIFSYGVMGSRTTSPYNSVTIVVKDLQIEPYLALTFDKETYYHEIFKLADNTNGKLFLPKKEWVHLGIGFDPSGYGAILLYKNGVFFGSKYNDQVSWLNITKTILSIGKPYGTSLSQYINFKGNVKNVQIFSSQGAVDMNKIIPAIYNGEEAPITSYYKTVSLPLQAGQDDDSLYTSKSFVYDTGKVETSSGFNSLGKPIRYRSASQAGVNYIPPASVDFANSAYFDGGYAEVDHKGVIPLENNSRTFALWVKVQGTAGNGGFLWDFGKEGSGGTFFNCVCKSNGRIYIPNSSTTYWTASNSKITFNKWVHLTYTFDSVSGEVKFYIDSVLDKTFTDTYKTTDTTLYIGGARGYWPDFSFSGNIANFQVYDRALTQDEVTNLYNQRAVTKGLLLHIPLQEGKDKDSMFTSKNFTYGEV